MSSLCERRAESACRIIKPVAGSLKTWLLDKGIEYIKSKKLNTTEEDAIGEFQEFYLNELENLIETP